MRKYRPDDKEFSEINITPFTDVILVVLIIFMITSPFLITGALKIKLPESSSSSQDINNCTEVYLNDKDQLFINNQETNISNLPAELQADFMRRNNKEVIIKADKDAVYGKVVNLFDVLKNSGAEKLLIATAKK